MTLKTGFWFVQGHWKWRRVCDRSYSTSYWYAVVNVALSCTVFELFDLEIWVRCHSWSFKLVPSESLGAVFYSYFIVTMALSCIILEIKHDIGRKFLFFHTPLHSAPVRGPHRNIAMTFGTEKLWCGCPMVKQFWRHVYSFDTIYKRSGRTDRQTDIAWRLKPRLMLASRGKHEVGNTSQNCYKTIWQHTSSVRQMKLCSG